MERSNIRYIICLLGCFFVLTSPPAIRLMTNRTVTSLILFLETGHTLRAPTSSQTPTSPQTEKPPVTAPPVTPDVPTTPEELETGNTLAFSSSDAQLVQVNSYCGYDPDVPAWLTQPLCWNLRQTAPTVLILHSHATEGYINAEGVNHRTQDTNENMVSVGDALAKELENAGIRVLHDRTLHDYPSYSDSYENSRAAAKKYLEENPSISLILDLHRDSVVDEAGNEVKYILKTPKGVAAKMMFVVGTDAGGLVHSKWSENMSLAVKLHALLEKQNPGICRPISFRTQRFNQDLSTGALLVEMGAAGNSRQEALLAAKFLADAVIDLANGTA